MDQHSVPDVVATAAHEAGVPVGDGPHHDPTAPASVTDARAATPGWSARDLVGVGLAAVGGAAIVLTMLVPRARSGESSVVTTAPRQSVQPTSAVAPARSGPAAALRHAGWHPANEWVGRHKRSVAFEVTAASPVRVWMRQVTPVLVVRCLEGSLDAFVLTESPSAIEPGRNDHSVRLVFDGKELVEHWADSAEHDGLFAPDGGAFLARLSGAQTLTVGFAPHNAPAVEAVFPVAGASELVAPLKKHCR